MAGIAGIGSRYTPSDLPLLISVPVPLLYTICTALPSYPGCNYTATLGRRATPSFWPVPSNVY